MFLVPYALAPEVSRSNLWFLPPNLIHLQPIIRPYIERFNEPKIKNRQRAFALRRFKKPLKT